MSKLRKTQDWKPGMPDYTFYCPGCKCDHGIWTTQTEFNNPVWNISMNLDSPSVDPSLMIDKDTDTQCHLIIKEGKIHYCDDCRHELAGQTVEMENIE